MARTKKSKPVGICGACGHGFYLDEGSGIIPTECWFCGAVLQAAMPDPEEDTLDYFDKVAGQRLEDFHGSDLLEWGDILDVSETISKRS